MSQFMPKTLTATVEATAFTTAHSLTLFGKGGNIPDGFGSFQDDIIVTENFKLNDVMVTLKGMEHTWVGDLVVRLHHVETETIIDLFRRPGQPHFSSSGYSNDLRGDYSFSDRVDGNSHNFDSAAASNAVIPSGSYTSLQPLAKFNGLSSTGTWRLIINDCSAGDSGFLDSWSLNLDRG
ncbi:MAG: proprotein convertase P-domain-containing protein [Coleofasciculaceae cyanobacterium]